MYFLGLVFLMRLYRPTVSLLIAGADPRGGGDGGDRPPPPPPPPREVCDKRIFPLIHTFLAILLTLPVSTASAERSFSSLRRLKTWMRSRMGEERLTGLAMLNVHRDIYVSVDKVIDRFAKSKNA